MAALHRSLYKLPFYLGWLKGDWASDGELKHPSATLWLHSCLNASLLLHLILGVISMLVITCIQVY